MSTKFDYIGLETSHKDLFDYLYGDELEAGHDFMQSVDERCEDNPAILWKFVPEYFLAMESIKPFKLGVYEYGGKIKSAIIDGVDCDKITLPDKMVFHISIF